MKKLISKKTLSIAMITGLVAVPGLVAAQVVTDDNPSPSDVVVTEPTQEEVTNEETVTETPVVENTDEVVDETDGTPVVDEEENVDSSVTAEQAQAIAEAKFPEKEVARVDTKNEGDKLTYRVRFTDAVKVDVLATDGSIVKIMAEKNQSGAHRQDGANRHSDDDGSDDSAADNSNRGRR